MGNRAKVPNNGGQQITEVPIRLNDVYDGFICLRNQSGMACSIILFFPLSAVLALLGRVI